jgi:hypothetical protein
MSYHDVSPAYNTEPAEEYLTKLFGKGNAASTALASDGSAGYGDQKLDATTYVYSNAPENIKAKFSYYFKSFPPEVANRMQMDEIASFSVTEANFADIISRKILSLPGVVPSMVITDATSCVGGNAMSFGRYFRAVLAIELDSKRAQMLENNLSVCKNTPSFGFKAEYKTLCGSYEDLWPVLVPKYNIKTDIVFFDPPWGGKDYKKLEKTELSLGSILMHDIVNNVGRSCPFVVMKLPKNYDMNAFTRGLKVGKVILDEDLSDGGGRVKMKIVVVRCLQPPIPQQTSLSSSRPVQLKLLGGNPTTWQGALKNVGGRNAFLGQGISVRGLYSLEDEESKLWEYLMKFFPSGVPRFRTKNECIEFCRELGGLPTNPGMQHLQHAYTTLVGWKQVIHFALPKCRHYRSRYPLKQEKPVSASNRYIQVKAIHEETEQRAQLPYHVRLNEEGSLNSLMYMFFHMRCGLYVMIRNGKVRMFVPFVNDDYTNTFSHLLDFDCSDGKQDTYYREKWEKYCQPENIISNKKEWWANANILCNQHQGIGEKHTEYWGDHHLLAIRDMFETACAKRDMPDLEFCINKRDHPQLKRDLTEPYDFIFLNKPDDAPPKLKRARYNTYAPIFSFYVGEKYADFALPLSDDWASATGMVFPDSLKAGNNKGGNDLYSEDNFKKFLIPWAKKSPTAFFRGNLTGGGVTKDTNQRIHLITLSFEWEADASLNGSLSAMEPLSKKKKIGKTSDVPSSSCGGHAFLDAKGTGWNVRDKKLTFSSKLTYPKQDKFDFESGRMNFVPVYKQSTYKYIVYVDGHSAANRYAFLMRLGCVVLKVQSLKTCAGDTMWYYPMLRPYDTSEDSVVPIASEDDPSSILNAPDHIAIKRDLSDLKETIKWCRENDAKCEQIAQNAMVKHKHFLMEEGILDYLEITFKRLARNNESFPWWFKRPGLQIQPPSIHPDTGDVNWHVGVNAEERWVSGKN